MTRIDIIAELDKLNINNEVYVALSGSEYWRINGVKVRVSDHVQPDGYVKNYIDTRSYTELLSVAIQLNNLNIASEQYALQRFADFNNISLEEAELKSNKDANCPGDFDSMYLSFLVEFEDNFINKLK